MTTDQIQDIVRRGAFPGVAAPAEFIETHISWVILTPEFAFKIKKPVQFGFLDFSTAEKRRFYCLEELRLNRRLAPELYLGVLPLALENGGLAIGAKTRPPFDYAVHMKRVDNRRQMDRMLAAGAVTAVDMERLAAVLASFHRKEALPPSTLFHPGILWADFAEIYRFGADIGRHIGPEATRSLLEWRSSLPEFLETHSARLIARVREGFWVDGHGDLHARNIFLTKTGPVVFDCIEFNPHFRQADLLNELAFLCMDLEASGRPDLAAAFLASYCRLRDIFPRQEDQLLFLFFKAYRANVRLKVALLELRQRASAAAETQVQQYWNLMTTYLPALTGTTPSGSHLPQI